MAYNHSRKVQLEIIATISAISCLISVQCFADEEKDLGIENKSYTNVSSEEAVSRSRTLAKKYEKIGDRMAGAIGLPVGAPKKETVGTTTIILKNGQVLSGATIGEKNKNGFWAQIDDSAKVYISNEEIKEVKNEQNNPKRGEST